MPGQRRNKQLYRELDGKFVEAGTPIAIIRHFLSKDEVLRIILKQALYLFTAPALGQILLRPGGGQKNPGLGAQGRAR